MILRNNFLKKIAIMICIVICFVMIGSPVLAVDKQENPDIAKVVFSGISLFQFYSGNLDSILVKNQQNIETNIQNSPFANVPQSTETSLHNFLSSANDLCSQILDLDTETNNINVLLHEFRYQEASPLINEVLTNLANGNQNLDTIEQAVNITGNEFQVATADENSGLYTAYAAVLDRIQKLKDLLVLYQSITEEQQTEVLNEKTLQTPDITLQINPIEAFVGDTINVEVTLSANGKPLGNRQIEILLNSTPYLTVTTDSQGHNLSSLQVPYWYIPEMQIQSLYYPQTNDINIYQSTLSSPATLKVLFYDTGLTLKTDTKNYPGKEASIFGQFSYGSSPLPDKRDIEIYLDNTLVGKTEVTGDFTYRLSLAANTALGKHLVTVSALANGRYDSVVTNAMINVKKTTPVLIVDMPYLAIIPGNIIVQGKIDSEIGPYGQANITIIFEGKQVEAVSSNDGEFTATIGNNIGFGLFGSQSIDFEVKPNESWQNGIITSRKIMTIYVVNCSIFFFILVVLGVILPRRLKFRSGARGKKRLSPEAPIAQQKMPSVDIVAITDNVLQKNDNNDKKPANSRLFYWYRIVIQLVQRASGVLLKPNQTLREFVRDTGKATGPVSKPLIEFTRMIERVLYSQHKVTEDEIKSGEQLARNVQEGLRK